MTYCIIIYLLICFVMFVALKLTIADIPVILIFVCSLFWPLLVFLGMIMSVLDFIENYE
jgi:predicted tellurium resistance membrane protein TerC